MFMNLTSGYLRYRIVGKTFANKTVQKICTNELYRWKKWTKTSGTGKFECETCVHLKKLILIFIFKTSGTGKFACKKRLHFQKYTLCLVFKTSGTSKFAYKTGLHFQKYVLFLVFKTSSTGKFACKTGLHFPKCILFFVFKNLLYRQICMQVYTPYTK